MLYIVPTPIGNLEDITFRAVRILKEVDFILAENILNSKKLLNFFKIKNNILSYNIYNEHKIIFNIILFLKKCNNIALIADAGTPIISDPGFLLVRHCIKNNIKVSCLPGATAFIPALINSGFSINEFTFIGFLPHKKGKEKKIKTLCKESRTIIIYESPYRILNTLYIIKNYIGNIEKQISICREISKKFEQTIIGNINDILFFFSKKKPKGEFVIILQGKGKTIRGTERI
ncbi:MAG: 16S rRNA (cytidine(1402)-2'-O)-methyltransferase [Candidatus Sulcia muelleri]|uniref:Ribosomal RNA small subunit methyltransferase I n=1 Tax=Karelsulcia muelleri (strain GWSS) TaxID=444179 RepID=A8Z5Q6_KARMG|nr:S-adenosyl-L-methionine dependent methyltransferase [Candidatus Karelsulcia muelleri GWSS]EAT14064.1 methyltransferase [Candidatus Karelsulcia muelleri str. Hc (Homalodisca coagulata)]MBS0018837.1 16S rRNA (cytidine(1402)-2'-O)-methyltransferase [Candidatus Karelsulcia muelleri]MCJ7422600.1 16S rRNA (cytidine(1402)-2'-O)-methyltransferase [Candidatus Karelsulcia muelleri]MCJ7468697.1 16S rRNA (cytidine(1402)-2'-O)-methyltransferase [Candidatus Karelsulcia muelleri]